MIRFFFRWAFRFLVLGIVLVVALLLLKNQLSKAVLENRLRAETGLNVQIRELELGAFAPTLNVAGLNVYNTPEFGGSLLLSVPELYLEYRPAALALGRLHLSFMRVNIPEIHIVEAKNGRTNVLLTLPDLDSIGTAAEKEPESFLGLRFTGVDTLNLSLGKLTYTSLRRPGRTTHLQLNLRNEIFTGVKSLEHFRELLMKALFRRGITIATDPQPSGRAARR